MFKVIIELKFHILCPCCVILLLNILILYLIDADEVVTAEKKFLYIDYTPTTKQLVCVLCGEKVVKREYRRKLFHGNSKTEFCILIEKHLDISICQDLHTDILCRKCLRHVQKLEETIKTLKESYNKTLQNLQQSHGKLNPTTKRQICEEETTSKRALFNSGVTEGQEIYLPLSLSNYSQNESEIEGQNRTENLAKVRNHYISLMFFRSELKKMIKRRINLFSDFNEICKRSEPNSLGWTLCVYILVWFGQMRMCK